jgi:hypothetical protein
MRLTPRSALTATLLVLLGALAGCAPEAEYTLDDVPVTPTALEWIQELSGIWQVQSVESGECPADLGLPPLHGLSKWIVEAQKLTISGINDERPDLTLFVSEPMLLLRSATLEIGDCEVMEEVELRVDEQTNNTLEGTYLARFSHDGSDTCEGLVPQEAESTTCEIASQWQAYRISDIP